MANAIPRLTTVRLDPQYQRSTTQTYAFLNDIETIAINHVEIVDQIPYFVIEVYCQARQSQIPTLTQRKHIVQQSLWKVHDSPSPSVPHDASRTPDYVLRRSLSAFQAYQAEICAHLDQENRGNCYSCNAWLTFTSFALTKSKVTMTMLPIQTVRRHELSKFIKAAVLLAVQATIPIARRQQCDVSDAIALSTSRFLEKGSAPF